MLKPDKHLFESDDDRESRLRTQEVVADLAQGRTLRVGTLVATLVIGYSAYLYWAVIVPSDGTPTTIGALLFKILLIALIAGIPFFVMAWIDPRWRSHHAATIAVAAWLIVFVLFSMKWGAACPKVAIFFFIPLTLGALVGHNIGMFNHPETFDPDKEL
jgi:hypothetical protein